MFKFLETVEARIATLVGANLSLASAGGFMADVEPYLGVLVKLGQIAVAAATVYYFMSKAKSVNKTKKDDE